MLNTKDWPRRNRLTLLYITICFTLTLFLVFFAQRPVVHASAGHSAAAADGPVINHVSVGFRNNYQDGNWVPVQVTLSNNGSDFNGTVSINAPQPAFSNGSQSTSIYQAAISLPSGSQKQITIYIPFVIGNGGNAANALTVNLLNNSGQKVTSAQSTANSYPSGDIYVGVLKDEASSFSGFDTISSSLNPNAVIQSDILNTAMLPANAEALKNFDMIVLNNFKTSTLSSGQLAALQSWVQQGGTLIEIGGPEWQHTLNPLPASLLPVTITGTDSIPAGTHLLPIGGPGTPQVNDTVQAPVEVSVASPRAGSSVLLSAGANPLIVQATQGQGSVFYLAFDPTLAPLAGWSNITNLWETLVLRSASDQLLSSGSQSSGPVSTSAPYNTNMSSVLQSFIPNTTTAIWLILVLLLGYVFILGPIRLLIVRRLKKRDWSWRIVLSAIVVFSLLSYGLAIQQKGTSIVSSNVSVIQLDPPDAHGSLEHVTNYLGIFVPSQGDYHVYFPDTSLVQSADQSQYGPSQAVGQTTITSSSDGTNVDLQGVDTWAMRTLVTKNDHYAAGSLVSHLILQNGVVTGTVTNTLPYALQDAYVLIGTNYAAVGDLQAGQTRTVNLTINSNQNQPSSLADQIASNHNISTNGPYNPYNGGGQPQDELHQRMTVLSALSGNSICGNMGPCPSMGRGMVIVKGGKFFPYGTNGSANGNDPLLLPNAAATLIAWTQRASDQSNKGITINGTQINGAQTTLVQAPLALNFSGSITVPGSLIPAQVVDVQQGQTTSNINNIQEPAPASYIMTTGSMTFEFELPSITKLQSSAMTLTDNTSSQAKGYYPNQGSGTSSDINHAHANLYNWQTNSWDSVTFNQNVLTVTDAQRYIGPGGRVLLQIANSDTTLGSIFFDKPALQLQGTVSN